MAQMLEKKVNNNLCKIDYVPYALQHVIPRNYTVNIIYVCMYVVKTFKDILFDKNRYQNMKKVLSCIKIL